MLSDNHQNLGNTVSLNRANAKYIRGSQIKPFITHRINIVEEITVSDGSARSAYITYLYNAVMGEILRTGGAGELLFADDRTAMRVRLSGREEAYAKLRDQVAEVVGIGYKYAFLENRLRACLPRREKKLLCAALIAADYEGDLAYIRSKLSIPPDFCLDGFYNFRLGALRDKWTHILEYIPTTFSCSDLMQFCEFLAGESKRKIYLKDNVVFGENFAPLKRSRLTGEEDVETEIMLSDAGYIYCLGKVEESVGKFLQKYYAERAIFS